MCVYMCDICDGGLSGAKQYVASGVAAYSAAIAIEQYLRADAKADAEL